MLLKSEPNVIDIQARESFLVREETMSALMLDHVYLEAGRPGTDPETYDDGRAFTGPVRISRL